MQITDDCRLLEDAYRYGWERAVSGGAGTGYCPYDGYTEAELAAFWWAGYEDGAGDAWDRLNGF
jgi:hypothetical protein